jgi:electron transport complex protein RnfC
MVALNVANCMNCGCCSFVCPAKRRLVQTNKLSKVRVRNYQQKLKEAQEKEAAKA